LAKKTQILKKRLNKPELIKPFSPKRKKPLLRNKYPTPKSHLINHLGPKKDSKRLLKPIIKEEFLSPINPSN